MHVRKVGEWTYNHGARNGDAGFYVEAVDAPDAYRYAIISFSFLDEEKQWLPLARGETVEVPLITPDQLANRLPSVKG